jgi:hypothetical protein
MGETTRRLTPTNARNTDRSTQNAPLDDFFLGTPVDACTCSETR